MAFNMEFARLAKEDRGWESIPDESRPIRSEIGCGNNMQDGSRSDWIWPIEMSHGLLFQPISGNRVHFVARNRQLAHVRLLLQASKRYRNCTLTTCSNISRCSGGKAAI